MMGRRGAAGVPYRPYLVLLLLLLLLPERSGARKRQRATRPTSASAAAGSTPAGPPPVDAFGGAQARVLPWREWAAGGGAEPPHPPAEELGQEVECTVERRAANAISEEEFLREFHLKKPLIISGATGHWELERFSREQLLARFADVTVNASQSVSIQRFGAAHPCGGASEVATTLGQFLEGMSLPADLTPRGTTKDPWYIFDHAAMHTTSAASLRASVALPAVFLHRHLDMILAAGPRDSGTQFHKHTDAWNVLLSGHKRWFLQVTFPDLNAQTTAQSKTA